MNTSLETAGNMFVFENRCCDCKVTTNYTDDGIEFHNLQLKATDEFYKYAYAPIDGLVKIDRKTGAMLDKEKIIEDFLNIDTSKVYEIQEFINTYGFIMDIPSDGKYRIFKYQEIGYFMIRFRVLVQLMSAIEDTHLDYDLILQLITYLLFSIPRRIVLNEDGEIICTPVHSFTKIWYEINSLPDITSHLVRSASNDPYEDFYLIPDTFTGKDEELRTFTYQEEVEDIDFATDESSKVFKAKITKLYRNAFNGQVDTNARFIIDYFYNLLNIDVEIDDILEDGKIHIKKSLIKYDKFDENFKNNIISLAKNTIKDEFDFVLYGIRPTYDIDSMSPNWHIPNLLTALYFSLFYTRPDYEVYRKCANPNCGRLFKVKSTNSRKKYHDAACQNSAAQMRHRKSRLEKKQ